MTSGNPDFDQKSFTCGVVEGFYGRPWTPEQRKELFRRLASMGMNTYVYAPKDDLKHRAYWRELYTVEEADHLQSLIDAARSHGIRFYYALSPGLDIVYSSQKEINFIKQKLDQVKRLGCEAFALLFDDIEPALSDADKQAFDSFAHAHVSVTNEIYSHLNQPFFMFCPTEYCESRAHPDLKTSEYLTIVGQKLHPDVMVMWTGPRVVSRHVSSEHIRQVAEVLRRSPLIWDNLHANDYDHRRLYLGPYMGRPLCIKECISGIVTNPNCEFEANWIAMQTLAHWSRCTSDFEPGEDTDAAQLENVDSRLFPKITAPQGCFDPIESLQKAIDSWVLEISIPRSAFTSDAYSQKPPPALPLPVIPVIPTQPLPTYSTSCGTSVLAITQQITTPGTTSQPIMVPSTGSMTTSCVTPIGPLPPSILSDIEIRTPVTVPIQRVQSDTPEVEPSPLLPDPVLALAVNSLTAEYDEPMETAPCSGLSTPLELPCGENSVGATDGAAIGVPSPKSLKDSIIDGSSMEQPPLCISNSSAASQGSVDNGAAAVPDKDSCSLERQFPSASSLTEMEVSPQRPPAAAGEEVITPDAVELTHTNNHSIVYEDNLDASDVTGSSLKEGNADKATENGPSIGVACSVSPESAEMSAKESPGEDNQMTIDDPDPSLREAVAMQVDGRSGEPSNLLHASNHSNEFLHQLSRDDVELLARMFYLPFEHSPLGSWLISEFSWLRDNGSVVAMAMMSGEIQRMDEWTRRAGEFTRVCSQATDLCSRLSSCANRGLVYDIFPYVWDAVGVLLMLTAFIEWLECGYYSPHSDDNGSGVENGCSTNGLLRQGTQGSGSTGFKLQAPAALPLLSSVPLPALTGFGAVPPLSYDCEPWFFRGGLFGELQRQLPLETGQDLFTIRPPCPPSAQILSIRPCRPEDKKALYEISKQTFDDGFDSSHRFIDQPDLPGDSAIGHLLEQCPEYAFVAEDSFQQSNSIVGFAIGALDARQFSERLTASGYNLRMRIKYPASLLAPPSPIVGCEHHSDDTTVPETSPPDASSVAQNAQSEEEDQIGIGGGAMESEEPFGVPIVPSSDQTDGAFRQDSSLSDQLSDLEAKSEQEEPVTMTSTDAQMTTTDRPFAGSGESVDHRLKIASLVGAFYTGEPLAPAAPVSGSVHSRYPSLVHIRILPSHLDSAAPKRLAVGLLSALKANGARGVFAQVRHSDRNIQDMYTRLGFFEVTMLDAEEAMDHIYFGRIL